MKLKSHLLLFFLLLTGISACDTSQFEEAIENFGVVIGLDSIQTTGTVLITDAKTGELVRSTVSLRFTGAESNSIIDMYSDPITSAETETGVFNFGLMNNITPDGESPVQIDLQISAEGYLPSTERLAISQAGNNSFSIELIDTNNPPEGIQITNTYLSSTDANGLTDEAFNLNFSSEPSSASQETDISVSIKAGSTFFAENGSALTGTLIAEAIYYNGTAPFTVNAVPNNLLSNEGDSALVMLGAIDLTIKSDDNKEAISIQNTMNNGTGKANQQLPSTPNNQSASSSDNDEYIINFILNESTYYQLLRVLRLAYISPTTGERFILYTVPEIAQLPDGRVNLRYLLSGTLFKTLALVYFSEQPCTSSLSIVRNNNSGKISVEIFEKGFQRSADLQSSENSLVFRNVTRGVKTVRVKLPFTTYETNIDFCNTSNPSIDLPTPPTNLIDARLQLNVRCPNPSDKIGITDLPASSIIYREVGAAPGTPWRVGTNLTWDYDASLQSLTAASCSLNGVAVGKKYLLKINYGENQKETTVEIAGTVNEFFEVIDEAYCF